MPIRHLSTLVVRTVLLVLGTTLLALGAVLVLAPASIAAAGWKPPVEGAVTRSFDPGIHRFEGGRHRGVDLAAPPGASVRAPCSGAVAFAGAVGSTGRVVTLRCGPWRVTHLPLATTAARAGTQVDRGDLLGTVAASSVHRGLHLGVRREGERFGYADPLRFLTTRATPPPLGPAPRPAHRPRATPPRPPKARPPAPRTVRTPPALRRPAPRLLARPTHRPRGAPAADRPRAAPATDRHGPARPEDSNPGLRAPFAPWPAWVGLALVLAGAGVRVRARAPAIRRRAAAAGTVAP